MVIRGDRLLGGIDWEFGIDTCTVLYLKYITNKDLLYSTGNNAQYYFFLLLHYTACGIFSNFIFFYYFLFFKFCNVVLVSAI